MSEDVLEVQLQLDAGPDSDRDELELLTQRLRRQLLDLDVESVEARAADQPPPNTRAVDAMLLGSLVVTVAKSPELLKGVVQLVQGWLAGHHGRSVELAIGGDTLKVNGITSEDQQRLIDLFVARTAGRA
jgi:hypothetical protein